MSKLLFKPKVFCIGWHKTGTTTLGDALLELGYNVLGARIDLAGNLMKGDFSESLNLAEKFEALQDVPWAAMFKELDKQFPNSKYILTIRDEQKWLISASKHFGNDYSSMREWLYGVGVLIGNEEIYLKRYQDHNNEVLEYFKNRSKDLLILDLNNSDGWRELCPFLGLPISSKKFPHSNKGKHSFTLKDKAVNALKNIVPLSLRKLRLRVLRLFGVPDPRYRFNNRQQNSKVREEINIDK